MEFTRLQLDEHAFHMPQLSVLTEMEIPELWIPIPLMYGVSRTFEPCPTGVSI